MSRSPLPPIRTTPLETLLSVADVAALLQVSRRTVYNLQIKHVKFGRSRRYERHEVAAYVALSGRGKTRAA